MVQLVLQLIRELVMDLDKVSQDQYAIDTYRYVQPGKPLIYLWIAAVIPLYFLLEFYIFKNHSLWGIVFSIPGFLFFFFMMYACFTGAAKLEIDNESVRRSLLGWNIISILWQDAKVIQSFPFPVRGGGLVHNYRFVSKSSFLFFGIISRP
ncbi:hypothetical protein ADT25_10640 [Xanthomonas oryzae]|uniref:Uncharacterized protein n=1 Tax=Xanthomonas oryzae TaxID=347 RepID=A0AAP0ZKZ2_9XANT|nr:hypothetical protein ADT25_10640 [Xanthomonas oryzae]